VSGLSQTKHLMLFSMFNAYPQTASLARA
jgi:hypothetical protein